MKRSRQVNADSRCGKVARITRDPVVSNPLANTDYYIGPIPHRFTPSEKDGEKCGTCGELRALHRSY